MVVNTASDITLVNFSLVLVSTLVTVTLVMFTIKTFCNKKQVSSLNTNIPTDPLITHRYKEYITKVLVLRLIRLNSLKITHNQNPFTISSLHF